VPAARTESAAPKRRTLSLGLAQFRASFPVMLPIILLFLLA
jgi:hypothetical protein